MSHIEVLIVPLLMLADYGLTMVGASLYGRTAAQRAAYELNPLFKSAVGKLQIVNVRHILSTALIGLLLWQMAEINEVVFQAMLGGLSAAFALVISIHVANIGCLLLNRRWPDEVKGQLQTSERHRLASTAIRMTALTLPFFLLASLAPNAVSLGAAAGALWMALVPVIWLRNLDAKKAKTMIAQGTQACSFCERPSQSGQRLITSPRAMICDECVTTCVEVLAAQPVPGDARSAQSMPEAPAIAVAA